MKNLVHVSNGSAVVSSKHIADSFGKIHRDVLRSIKNIQCSDDFRVRNFAQSYYQSEQGKRLKCFDITRDGFAFLCMGFTGDKAAEWKEKYITAFNAMEQYIVTEQKDLSLIDSLNIASKKIDDIQAAGSAWGKNGTLIRKHKKAAIENLCDLMDKAQLKLGFSK